MPAKRQRTTDGKCKAKTKAGRPCAAHAMRGKKYCSLHGNPERAAELGRKGGLRNRRVYEDPTEPVAPPESAADVRRLLAETMAELKAGGMDPKVASNIAAIGATLLRAYEAERNAAERPPESGAPTIYRALFPNRLEDDETDVIDLPNR